LVFGSTKHMEGVHGGLQPGTSACYVVADDVDAVHRRATRAGAEIVEAPYETTFGSGMATHAFTARDPEGNLGTFGTYRGAP
jgi:predicted enzyme related to lactoylglutathione lyase